MAIDPDLKGNPDYLSAEASRRVRERGDVLDRAISAAIDATVPATRASHHMRGGLHVHSRELRRFVEHEMARQRDTWAAELGDCRPLGVVDPLDHVYADMRAAAARAAEQFVEARKRAP